MTGETNVLYTFSKINKTVTFVKSKFWWKYTVGMLWDENEQEIRINFWLKPINIVYMSRGNVGMVRVEREQMKE